MSKIALGTAKEWIQISHDAEDTVLQVWLDAAEEEVQKITGTVWDSQEVVEDLPGGGQYLFPTKHPITAVSSIVCVDNSAYTFTNFEWRTGGASGTATPRIWRTSGDSWCWCHEFWPTGKTEDNLRVTYTAGYATAADIPDQMKAVVLDLLKFSVDTRGGAARGSGQGVVRGWNMNAREEIIARLATVRSSTPI